MFGSCYKLISKCKIVVKFSSRVEHTNTAIF
uniref:Uncharacterized protein n=1 Tax=Anguilla anguilla TaxID=7936 RepID=A0A0E9RS23_ANGAN